MTITELIKNSIADTEEISRVYFCGNEKIWKIGETTQKVSQRMSEIRKIDKNINYYVYFEFNGDVNLRLFIESALKMSLVSNGYKNIQKDHFIIKGEAEEFERCFINAMTIILNDFRIDYTIKYNEKMG